MRAGGVGVLCLGIGGFGGGEFFFYLVRGGFWGPDLRARVGLCGSRLKPGRRLEGTQKVLKTGGDRRATPDARVSVALHMNLRMGGCSREGATGGGWASSGQSWTWPLAGLQPGATQTSTRRYGRRFH